MIYIIVQTVLTKQENNGTTINNFWENVVRKVEAKDRETAIGKFVIQTNDIKAKEKLGIECIELSIMKKLN
tara:strand:- start:1023 stop:1235 length:213 start_codon:yes stop_codon:yes gene_type:complete